MVSGTLPARLKIKRASLHPRSLSAGMKGKRDSVLGGLSHEIIIF